MAAQDIASISIPSYKENAEPKPHIVYNVLVKLSVRSYTLEKRFNDFKELASAINTNVKLPSNPLLSIVKKPNMIEERKKGLEEYLKKLCEDDKTRTSEKFRAFLRLPALTKKSAQGDEETIDFNLIYRQAKAFLHEARIHLSNRDGAVDASDFHSSSAMAKKKIIEANSRISSLDTYLMSAQGLGDGEKRRRRDLVQALKSEKAGIEELSFQPTINRPGPVDEKENENKERQQLLGDAEKRRPKSRRVFGAVETEETKKLDNNGLLGLQQQIFSRQDDALETLHAQVKRQKELGLIIQDELDQQADLIDDLDRTVDKVGNKLGVARKQLDKLG